MNTLVQLHFILSRHTTSQPPKLAAAVPGQNVQETLHAAQCSEGQLRRPRQWLPPYACHHPLPCLYTSSRQALYPRTSLYPNPPINPTQFPPSDVPSPHGVPLLRRLPCQTTWHASAWGLSLDPRCVGSLILGCVFEFAFFPIRQPGQRTSESAVAGALSELGTGSEKGCGRAHEACDGPCATRCEVRDICMYCIATASRVRLTREACPLAVMGVPA